MAMKHKRRPSWWSWAAQCALGGVGLALITLVCFQLELNVATVGFAYVVLIALLSLLGSFAASVVLSIVAVACLNYFFVPPLFDFRVDYPMDVVALAAFATTSLVVTVLTTRMRKSAEAAQAREQQWREIFEHNPVMYFIVDSAGTVLSVNGFGAAQLGYTVDELVGRSVWKVFLEEDREAVRRNVGACLERPGQPRGWEARKIRKDGGVIWVRENAKAVRRPDGRIIVLVACEDITERKRTEDALRQNEMYLAEAQRLSRTGNYRCRVQTGEFSTWSDEMSRIYEMDPAVKPTSQSMMERIHPEDRARVRQSIERMPPGGMEFEHRLLMTDGSIKHVRVVAHCENGEPGEPTLVGAVMDITAARRAEEELQRAREELARVSRLTTLGELTAAIAHEVNQPLTGLVSSGKACLRWLADDKPNLEAARRSVERMIQAGSRAAEVIDRLRALMKKSPARKDRLNVNAVITEVISLVRSEVRRNRVSLQTALADDLPPVLGDRIQLQQVILNLIVNANEAMTGVTDGPREVVISSAKGDATTVLLTVADSGPGFDGAKLENVFEAFYTTKPEGMGIGLAVSRSIVEAHGGKLWAMPNKPRGAVLQFTLPAWAEEPR